MGKKIDYLKSKLKRDKIMPGPGQYNSGNNLADAGSQLVPNQKRASIGQANDRWRGYVAVGGPPSCRYDVDEGISKNVRSTHIRSKRPVFGSDSKTYVDECWQLKYNSE